MTERDMTKEFKARMRREGLKYHGQSVEIVHGKHDGENLHAVSDGRGVFWISDARPGQFRTVFVPIDMQYPRFIE
jgi:hypothetical protein